MQVLKDNENLYGFAWLECASRQHNGIVTLKMFSVRQDMNGMGIGKTMLELIEARLPKCWVLRAECTPYAKGMKALLRHSGFKRERQSIVPMGCHGLDVYIKDTSGV
ncbi:GNAT family N-acetyltransferase [Aquitalea sp. LB_tupeE]|uniref:GNAT family N-acetyltransferase n=1 Tax=Aquitalea sp. LB_tupeE TaxID=2748078 RepID=UPI0015BB0588|nr:GNAT family N-acetyltransferase [Aquitalea sp. LB_tupeE]NWK77229.1 GNAT family N-acetyltransferase [Aquitalea sp. LB_tupeE]